jgi:aminoglycoside 3-N-acetyltransferase I
VAAMIELKIKRVSSTDLKDARQLFTLMARVFAEPAEPLSDDYIARLLSRPEFWALAAFSGAEIIGGITAHVLPMTRSESSELFIYDLAVHADFQRKGVGRRLVTALCEQASEVGIREVFVSADNDDTHALDFYRNLGGLPSPVTMFTFSPI